LLNLKMFFKSLKTILVALNPAYCFMLNIAFDTDICPIKKQ